MCVGFNGVYDGANSDGVLLWIFDGVNSISWTLVGFWIPHGWTLDFGIRIGWFGGGVVMPSGPMA